MILTILRHAERNGEHLTSDGVKKSRFLGDHLVPFQIVVTSPMPRAIETAVAMGYGVEETLQELSEVGMSVFSSVDRKGGFGHFVNVYSSLPSITSFAQKQARLWLDIVRTHSSKGNILVITHGGIIEFGLIACFAETDFSSFGDGFNYLEGIELFVNNMQFTDFRVLRFTSTN